MLEVCPSIRISWTSLRYLSRSRMRTYLGKKLSNIILKLFFVPSYSLLEIIHQAP